MQVSPPLSDAETYAYSFLLKGYKDGESELVKQITHLLSVLNELTLKIKEIEEMMTNEGEN